MPDQLLSKRERAARRRRRRRQILGAVVLCLSLVGAASLVTLAVRGVLLLTKPPETDLDFRPLVAPLVSMDPTPFETIEDAEDEVLLESAIWAVISYEDVSRYSRNEEGHMLVPTVDVDLHLTRMYGRDISVTHRTFSNLDLTFTYVEESHSYAVPITSQSGAYFPRIESETVSGNTCILTVAYMQYSGTAAEIVMDDESEKVVKYMEYVLLRDGGSYYIYAVRDAEQPVDGSDTGN